MKSVILMLMIVCCSLSLFGQAPEAFKYQAVVRDAEGQILDNKSIDLRISILKDSEKGLSVFTEYHKARTNDFGLVSLAIGGGEAVSGEFESIDWSLTSYFVKIEIDADRDERYDVMGSSRLLSVPYALYAKSAGSVYGDQAPSAEDRASSCQNTPYNWCDDCKCVNGIKTLEVLYLGPSSKDIFIYTDQKLTDLVDSFPNAQDGDILNIDASGLKLGALGYYTYFAFKDSAMEVIRVNTSCQERIIGETFKYFTMIAQKDKQNNACDVCDLRDDWKLGGNAVLQYDSLCNRIGTSNRKDFVMISDNKSRLMLHKDGMVEVTNRNPTLLSGTLTVDKATDLNATLNVDGPADMNSTLQVDSNAIFNRQVLLNANPLSPKFMSTSTSTGALVVLAGIGVGGRGTFGEIKVEGKAEMSELDIFGGKQSTSPTIGALVVSNGGGTGVTGNLNVGMNTKLDGTLTVEGFSVFNKTNNSSASSNGAVVIKGGVGIAMNVNIGQKVKIFSSENSLSKSTGALVVENGGVGIEKNLYVGGKANVAGNLELRGQIDLSTSNSSGPVARFVNTSTSGDGIVIQVGASTPNNNHEFIEFRNGSGGVVGRIEGEKDTEFGDDLRYAAEIALKTANVAIAAGEAIIAGADAGAAAGELIGASTSATGCVGLGACVTAPVPSLIISEAASLVVAIANVIASSITAGLNAAELADFILNRKNTQGVTYKSGSGDYAEYLLRKYPEEIILPGDVVGMTNGLVTKETFGAEKVMVISKSPIMVGAMPSDEDKHLYEEVAFIGQVYTKVYGEIEKGDYLIPSGLDNGLAIGKSADELTIREYKKILGIAWEDSEGPAGIVNTAIGLNVNDLASTITKLNSQVENQNNRIQILEDQVSQLIESVNMVNKGESPSLAENISMEDNNEHHQHVNAHSGQQEKMEKFIVSERDKSNLFQQTSPDDIYYHKMTDREFDEAIARAKDIFIEAGANMSKHPFWARIDSEPEYRAEVKADIAVKLEKAFHHHKRVNEDFAR